MPFVKCTYSGDVTKKSDLARALSAAVATCLKKPEAYVCMQVEHSDSLLFGGSADPAAMIHIEAIGGSCGDVAETLTKIVTDITDIPAARIFVNFISFQPSMWAMNGSTFG
eukprot:gene2815-5537_t